MAQASKKTGDSLIYRGRPLLRQDSELYYGDMRDPYIVMLRILDTTKLEDFTIASKVDVTLMKTAPDTNPLERIVKHGEKDGLYDALDIGAIWLERALANEEGEES